MSENLVRIALRTQPTAANLNMQHYLYPDKRISHPVKLNVVRAMGFPGGEVIENPHHSTSLDALDLTGETTTESITLPYSKANRLVTLFEQLRPGHGFECHDVVIAFEGWDHDRGLSITQHAVQPPEFVTKPEPIKPGEAYTVQVVKPDTATPEFLRTHSAIGTDNDRLLGLLGNGLMMATLDLETTRSVYANGAQISLLAHSIIPE